MLAGVALGAALLAQSGPRPTRPSRPPGKQAPGEWLNYGRDPGGQRYSPLKQITPANVGQLGVAWVYNTGFTDRSYQATPLVANGIMYVTTPTEQVVALEASTGKQLWKYDPQEPRVRVNRGVSYWPGDAQHTARIVLATSGDGRLIELDARSGDPVASFGHQGAVVVRDGLAPADEPGNYAFTSPPAIYRDLIILAPDLQEGPSHGLPGTVSAYNAITGALAWRFYLAPRPGEFGADTWGPDGTVQRSGPAAWDGISVDAQRGLVFVNTANPADSYYGADRPGYDLFANSLVVLDAATGKLRWYFQTVHHDTTDTDMAGPPLLVNSAGNHGVPAVATISKQALLFILNRNTGQPVFGVKEKPVTPSDVPGEHSSPTQPFPL
ncbi:MAG: PQQ-binding-like beta-propeller repeat protein, partial [Terriglobales bacterium]